MTQTSRRRVLLVTTDFPPLATGGRFRPLKLARLLPFNGWDPTVLTISAPLGSDDRLTGEIPSGTRVIRACYPQIKTRFVKAAKRLLLDTPPADLSAARGRQHDPSWRRAARTVSNLCGEAGRLVLVPDNYAAWIPLAVAVGLRDRLKWTPDVILASAPSVSSFIVAYVLSRLVGTPWVAEYRDLWTGDHWRHWVPPIRAAVEHRLERFLISNVHSVLTVSPGYREHLMSLHPSLSPGRIRCIPNSAPIVNDSHNHGIQPRPGVFVHTGPLGATRQPQGFFEAFARVAPRFRDPLPRVVLAGSVDPEFRAPLERLSPCEPQGAPLFEFLGSVAHGKSLALQQSAFVLILFVNRGANTHGTIPGKIFEYIAARRPILAIADSGDAADIVQCGRLGWVVPHETAAIAAFLERFLSNPDRMISETYRPDWTYLNRFDETVMAAQVADALEAAARSSAK